MKSVKRVVALMLTVLMVATTLFTVNVFADEIVFPDVAEDYTYRSAIYSLVQKGVVNGIQEDDGTLVFKPEKTISRAEFAKMLTVALIGNAPLTGTTDKFPDVSQDHWANKYIAYAVSTGIVNGRDDGLFCPENPVSYGEAIKMIVCAKGYGSLYKASQPWYQGYITIANNINLTKNAMALGTAEAPRGLVAQLVYNMDYTKKIEVNTGEGPTIVEDEEENEEFSGVVLGVFNKTLTGESLGLNRFQLNIGGKVFTISGDSIDGYYSYLGKMVEVEHTTDSVPKIVRIEPIGGNTSITIPAEDIDTVGRNQITYYDEDGDKETAYLSSNLYVMYNGTGVPQSAITSAFASTYFNVDCGELTLVDNSGGSEYDIVYVKSYRTLYVTGRSTDKDIYTFTDGYTVASNKTVTLENDDDDYVVYKTNTSGKLEASTVSAIPSSKAVISVAEPYNGNGVTEVMVSTLTLKNASVDEMSGYDYVKIGGKTYSVSNYYLDLLASDPGKYGFDVGDKATFYLDYAGRIVYVTKSESSEPYAYVLGYDPGNGLDGKKSLKLFSVSGTTAKTDIYPLKSSVRVNGSTIPDSAVEQILIDNAIKINAKQSATAIENGTYAQLIKYATGTENGVTCISELYTIDSANLANGGIVPGEFTTTNGGTKEAFSDGSGRLKYNSSSKSFAVNASNGANQFIINSSTVVILVPKDRADEDKFKKRTNTYFSNGGTYVVEPYDVTSNIAKAVLVYAENTQPRVLASADAMLIEAIAQVQNDEGKAVNEITYYKAGETESKKMKTKDLNVATGINPGDIVRFAVDNGEVVAIQKVYVGGELYDYASTTAPFGETLEPDNIIEHKDNANASDYYYRVIRGTVDTVDIDYDSLQVVPGIDDTQYDKDKIEPLTITDSAKFYKFDTSKEKFSTDSDLGSLNAATIGGTTDPSKASKVVIVILNRAVKAVYVLN